MNMRIFTVSVILLISESTFSQQYWLNVPSPTTKDFYKCHLLDTVYGWAAGDSGIIIHTSNSGVNWNIQNSGINFMIDDIFFVNRRLGWAIANDFLFFGTTILRTTNGGINWSGSRYPDTTLVFNTVYFQDSATGFLSGYTGQIYKTTNGGFSWFECHVDTAYCQMLYLFPKWDMVFMNSSTGFACGGQIDIQGIVWRTTDAGLNWYTYCIAPEPLLEIKAINQSKVVATGGDPDYGISFVKSYDAGLTWSYQETGLFGMGRSLAFRTPSELWIPGFFLQKFALNLDSGNAGAEWIEISPPAPVNLNAAQFVTPTYGWAFGGGGTILKYNTAVIGIGSIESQVPEGFTLRQNYPNPFNPASVIRFEIPELDGEKFVNLSIFDALGRLVSEPVNALMSAGGYSIDFDGSDMPSGVYFYVLTLKTEGYIEYKLSKKMVLLK
jgi:photosystem II stability/assembly factor-like uncharacterized protein